MANTENHQDRQFSWPFWFTLPLYPYQQRRTIRQEVLKETIWTFEQLQGIFYVVVPIRMTVVRLETGGLLIYAPVAPTEECIHLLQELITKYGAIKYIILPTISGLEHKVFVGPFARRFQEAEVFVAPEQWSFPVNLPLSWLGLPPKRTQVLPTDSHQAPFADEFDYAILGPIHLGPGKFGEVAFFHRRSHTLLLTDLVVCVTNEPPPIVQLNSYPLLFHAKDKAADIVADTPENRRKGWQRTCLFALYFRPSVLDVIPLTAVVKAVVKGPNRSHRAFFGLFPFQWRSHWQQSFAALQGNSPLLVAPILQTLILNRAPKETIEWADKVTQWEFRSIIPCHFHSPIIAEPHQLRQAFSFLEKNQPPDKNVPTISEKDRKTLREIDNRLTSIGIVPPPKDQV